MLIPAFKIFLRTPVQKKMVAAGKFDGAHPAIACGTVSGSVLIHSPHTKDSEEGNNEMRKLSVNRKMTAMCTGDKCADDHEMLLIGTQTNLLAYDAELNQDIFFKDVPDGINTMIFGQLPQQPTPIAIVGGNCSLQGFDKTGKEVFWTVTGDNVTALTFCDVGEDGKKELLVGSEDFVIRIFQDEQVFSEVTEQDVISELVAVHDTLYGYALQNGTIGIYNKLKKVWASKTRNKVHALGAFDLDADGIPEMLVGWSDGLVEVRSDRDGDVIYKDKFPEPIAGMVQTDYRMDDKQDVVVVACDGEMRGYLPAEREIQAMAADPAAEEAALIELTQRKTELLAELKQMETTMKQTKTAKPKGPLIPTCKDLRVELLPNKEGKCLDMKVYVSASENNIIKTVVVFAEGMFEGESLIVHPKVPPAILTFPVKQEKDIACDMSILAVVGSKLSTTDYVLEISRKLPRFASFMMVPVAQIKEPASGVTFRISERANRVVLWMNVCFNIEYQCQNDTISVGFVSLRGDNKSIIIKMTQEQGGLVTIKTDDLDLAGSVVQDMASYLGIADLESTVDFPDEMNEFRNVLVKVDEFNRVRLRLSADIADSSNLVKTLVIKAEDARILGNMPQMKKMYTDLYDLNRELIGEYTKRANNHAQLLASLKDVNQMIQKAAKCRMGKFKTEVVNACRAAIKANNIQSLFRIIKTGHAGP